MKIVLGKFARSSIETEIGPDLAVGVRAALAHYTSRLKSTWTPVAPPHFDRGEDGGDTAEAFELPVEAETEAAFAKEASRHGVPLDEVLSHAVLTYLADLDAAAAADRPGTLAGARPFASCSPDASLL